MQVVHNVATTGSTIISSCMVSMGALMADTGGGPSCKQARTPLKPGGGVSPVWVWGTLLVMLTWTPPEQPAYVLQLSSTGPSSLLHFGCVVNVPTCWESGRCAPQVSPARQDATSSSNQGTHPVDTLLHLPSHIVPEE